MSELQKCYMCKDFYPLSSFYGGGATKRCKVCSRNYDREYSRGKGKELKKKYSKRYSEKNKEKVREKFKVWSNNLIIWANYFMIKYGDNPFCSICNKQLYWVHADKRHRVYFDHRNGGKEKIKSPSTFYYGNKFNEETRELWESCKFGILCCGCNLTLPTKLRKEWLQKVTDYILIESD